MTVKIGINGFAAWAAWDYMLAGGEKALMSPG